MSRYLLLALAALLGACGGGTDEAPEALGKLDFRPSSAFGFDAVITGLRLGKEVVDARAPEDGVARAEGYRYLLRQIEMNLAMMTGDHDPLHPSVTRCPSKNCKLGFDSPDYTYVGANPLSANYSYRLYGQRGNAQLILFQVLERSGGPFKGTSKTESESLVVAADGSWEIYLGRDKPAQVPDANFLRLSEDQATLLVRIAHNDWLNTVEPSINIEVVGPAREAIEPFTPMRMAVAGFALSKMIPNQLQRWVKRLQDAPLNGVDEPCGSWGAYCAGEGGFGNYATGGRYQLATDEALILEVPAVPVKFQNIQLGNIWAESLDYANRQTSLNGHQAHLDSDGVYRYVLAHSDPGVPNWLDIAHHPEGGIFMRWLFPQGDTAPPQPGSKVVPLSELRDHLPADTPVVSAVERGEQLKARAAAINRRRNPAGYAGVQGALEP
ncbi:MAG: DUF1214 domain-containing protein [Halioglobus sp.]|nr:DUF1214 domain-containing protein [Halioglobus sp.]